MSKMSCDVCGNPNAEGYNNNESLCNDCRQEINQELDEVAEDDLY